MSSGDLAFLQHLTEHLGVSLENSRLYREVVFANLRWEETFKAVTEQIILVGKDFTLLRVNEATSDFYHLDRPRTGKSVIAYSGVGMRSVRNA